MFTPPQRVKTESQGSGWGLFGQMLGKIVGPAVGTLAAPGVGTVLGGVIGSAAGEGAKAVSDYATTSTSEQLQPGRDSSASSWMSAISGGPERTAHAVDPGVSATQFRSYLRDVFAANHAEEMS